MHAGFALAGAAMALAVAFTNAPAIAGANDYAFQPVSAEVKTGKGVLVSVRLVHKPSGKPVAEAVVIRSRLDMSPDGMGQMTAPLTAMPGTEPGVCVFRADLGMAGGWALKLMAKVQGEPETIEGTVVFKARN